MNNMEVPNKSQKRKAPPQSSNPNSQSRGPKRSKINSARTVLTQASDAALNDGALDLQSFLKSREFEIKALEDGMRRAKGALTTRAFQQVPRDMRRRTASHNVKRVPKRLQKRAKREMKEDNTPTVEPRKRKPGGTRSRLRAETAKRLGLLAGKKKVGKAQSRGGCTPGNQPAETGILVRDPIPKARKGMLNPPPKAKSKFRKRQIHKTWLPTHLWHAKRARMTEPKSPLWRFAVPLTCTEKSYRPTHRAGGVRGAVAWDMSYISTIGLEGSEAALEKVLRGVGLMEDRAWGKAGQKWRDGKRSLSGWLSRDVKGERRVIGTATFLWVGRQPILADDPPENVSAMLDRDTVMVDTETSKKPQVSRRQMMIRIHPAGFLELWTELLRLSKMQRPAVHLEDLRFELGSIDITGPGSTEALLAILHPFDEATEPHAKMFRSLAGVTNAASLPSNALLTFSIMDPRLRYPPRKVVLPRADDEAAAFSLLETISKWPVDQLHPPISAFDRNLRHKATKLPSQKALNRRKSLAAPGNFPPLTHRDPPIPVIITASKASADKSIQGTFTLVAPWKCILPIWHGLMHCPLSSGGNPRFGGLQEIQQIHFEHGTPWYPADYPGMNAGWAWEIMERERRKKEWEARPKGKRTAFESIDLGLGRKGEIGMGWACDFERLLLSSSGASEPPKVTDVPACPKEEKEKSEESLTSPVQHMTKSNFLSAFSSSAPDVLPVAVATVRISLFSRGVPQACARIYRLPSTTTAPLPSSEPEPSAVITQPTPVDTSTPAVPFDSSKKSISMPSNLRQEWLALAPANPSDKKAAEKSKARNKKLSGGTRLPASATLEERRRALAKELLRNPPLPYPATRIERDLQHPAVPSEEDLIGFVTTGNYNLAEGQGTGIGTILVNRVIGAGKKGREAKMCIVRNAGESRGRLGFWEAV